jgi:AcrR family transcriptional regulator
MEQVRKPPTPEQPHTAAEAGQTDAGGTDAASDPVRTRILRGAAGVFGERGYGATSVEAILEAAHVSRRTFYRTFRSKEDVLRSLFDRSVQRLVRTVREQADPAKSHYEQVVASVEAYLKVHANAGPLARVLLLEQFSPESPLVAQRNRALSTFSKLLTSAAEGAGQKTPDPVLVAAVVAGINQVCVQMATQYPKGDWDIQRAKRAILRILSALEDAGAAEG